MFDPCGFAMVYVAVDFKKRKPESHTAGVSIYWGEHHSANTSHPLRGDKLTSPMIQLAGNFLKNNIDSQIVSVFKYVENVQLGLFHC